MDAGNFQIFNCIGSGKVTGRPKIEHALPQWWQPILQSDWTKSIQNAVNFHSKVHLSKIYWPDDLAYEGIYYINNSIDLAMDSNHIIYGDGPSSLIVSSSNNPVFRMINNTGSPTGKEYASFENLMFQCMNGIQINQDDNSDPVETKQILNIKIKNCHFYNNGSTGNTAINLYETFDSVISENYIEGFEIGIKLAACDLNTISNNRIMKFIKYAILDLSRINSNGNLQFGSQNLIYHNDILIYNGPSNSGPLLKVIHYISLFEIIF
ncbi:hypothetical protein [Flavobacterium kingsejongi]|uniref:Right handed beta helix domain-containing protein n=1 Tax=Flavobacterium kingsejongi TaxID=1678728 RepID=A0A2S1LQ31_9FLAO|nr:hypothetical protein [Flavobacterium kingsejongi]AWG25772.1 hypothetical protein FK004_11340 [Flavobacterium kingsejongi]